MRALRRTGRALLALALALPALTLIAGPATAAPAPLVGVASGRKVYNHSYVVTRDELPNLR